MKYGLLVLVLSLFLAVAGAAKAASLVVIESDIPGIDVGRMIDAGASLTVPAGGRVVLVSESGRTLTLTGPFSGVPADPGGTVSSGSSLVSALSNLLQTGGTQTSSLGTMKGMDETGAITENPWAIDAERDATHCLLGDGVVTLWRANENEAVVLRLEAEVSGQRADVTWPAGKVEIDWPTGLPLVDGAGYTVSVETGGDIRGSGGVVMLGGGFGNRILVRLVPADLPTDAHRIAWMAENGCRQQAQQFLSTLR